MGKQFVFHRLGAELTQLHDTADRQPLVHLVDGASATIAAGAESLCGCHPGSKWEPLSLSWENMLCARCVEWTDEHENQQRATEAAWAEGGGDERDDTAGR